MNITRYLGQTADFLTLKEVLGKTEHGNHLGRFECNCGEQACKRNVDRIIQNIFRDRDRVNPISCGAAIKITGSKLGSSKKSKDRNDKFDNYMANQFITGRI